MAINQKIKQLREERNMTQEDLAIAIDSKRSTIASWERNITPPLSELAKLADFFGVPIDYFRDDSNTQEAMERWVKGDITSAPKYNDVPLDAETVNIICQIPLLNTNNKRIILDMIQSMLKNQN